MGPTRAWREPPAKHGFATDRERIAWAHGHQAARRIDLADLADELFDLLTRGSSTPDERRAYAELPDREWVYAALAGLAAGVADLPRD